jgi:hypothetical protein
MAGVFPVLADPLGLYPSSIRRFELNRKDAKAQRRTNFTAKDAEKDFLGVFAPLRFLQMTYRASVGRLMLKGGFRD